MADYTNKRSQLHPTMPNLLCSWGVFRCHWSFFLTSWYSCMQRCLWKGITCWNGGRGRLYLQSLWHLQSEGMYWAPWTIIYHISDQERRQKNFVYEISHSCLGHVISYNKLHMFDTGVWGAHAWKLICAAYSCLKRERQAMLEQRSVHILWRICHLLCDAN